MESGEGFGESFGGIIAVFAGQIQDGSIRGGQVCRRKGKPSAADIFHDRHSADGPEEGGKGGNADEKMGGDCCGSQLFQKVFFDIVQDFLQGGKGEKAGVLRVRSHFVPPFMGGFRGVQVILS